MSNILQTTIIVLLLGLLSCEKEVDIKSQLGYIQSNKYYSAEILPSDCLKLYGFSGAGYAPDYDYLEIKRTYQK